MSDDPWRNTGGPAFPELAPTQNMHGDMTFTSYPGMTLRDYFAAKVLTGQYVDGTSPHESQWASIAKQAYLAADAMLTERERRDG